MKFIFFCLFVCYCTLSSAAQFSLDNQHYSSKSYFNVDYSKSVRKIFVKITNSSDDFREKYIIIDSPFSGSFKLDGHQLYTSYIKHYFQVYLPPHSQQTYELKNFGHQRFDGFVYVKDTPPDDLWEFLVIVFFAGGASFILFYNLIFAITTKQFANILYFLFNSFYLIIILDINNFFYFFELTFIQHNPFLFSVPATFLFYIFSIKFLNVPHTRINYIQDVISALSFILLGVETFHNPQIGPLGFYLDLLILLSVLMTTTILLLNIKKKKWETIIFFSFFSFDIITIVLWLLFYYGMFEGLLILRRMLLVGNAIEIILFSVWIGYKYRFLIKKQENLTLLQHEKERYQNLLRILSHDINNPLTSAIMSSKLLAKKVASNSTESNYLEKLNTNLQRISSIISYTREEEKKTSTATKLLTSKELYKIINTIFEYQLKEKNLRFKFTGKNITIPINEHLLINNIVSNLVSNAIKFSNMNSEITLQVDATESYIILSICDQGVGIPPEILHDLQNHKIITSLGTKQEKGTGLGIQILRNCLAQYSAKLEITSSSHGSKFKIIIPKLGMND